MRNSLVFTMEVTFYSRTKKGKEGLQPPSELFAVTVTKVFPLFADGLCVFFCFARAVT